MTQIAEKAANSPMPELPEVEYVARQLRAGVIGRRIVRAQVLWERAIQGMTPDAFTRQIVGRRITAIGRRAKYLLITLAPTNENVGADKNSDMQDTQDTGDTRILVVHRRMSGNLLLIAPERAAPLADTAQPSVEAFASAGARYTQVALTLDNDALLLYTDPRKFGRLTLTVPDALPTFFAAIGPEPLDDAFTSEALAKRLTGKRAIKATLLDQAVIAGLGNIYADESLFRAGIHPLRPADSLTSNEVTALHAGIRGALETGITHGGTTFGRHRDIYDEAGTNLEHVEVYQHTGQPCPRCGTPIQRIVVTQRGTHFCPNCQPLGNVSHGNAPTDASEHLVRSNKLKASGTHVR
ncbi:MAG: bifunctional DNA-formamidopyrimidine glycosylase/DNA-(apurinic or apyrimidinic site) lyase [Ktedonobacterales bacterium]